MACSSEARKGRTTSATRPGRDEPDAVGNDHHPETRRLSAGEDRGLGPPADDIFTTLMEIMSKPRREFIEKNALSVTNLDI